MSRSSMAASVAMAALSTPKTTTVPSLTSPVRVGARAAPHLHLFQLDSHRAYTYIHLYILKRYRSIWYMILSWWFLVSFFLLNEIYPQIFQFLMTFDFDSSEVQSFARSPTGLAWPEPGSLFTLLTRPGSPTLPWPRRLRRPFKICKFT